MLGGGPINSTMPEPVVDPLPDCEDEALHSLVVIGIGPALISTWPFATRTHKRTSGFGGGPAATVPSVVNASVARTHEELGVRQPADRATHVGAIDGKSGELSSLTRRSQAAPLPVMPAHGSGEGSGNGDVHGLADFEIIDFPDGKPVSGILRNSGATTNPTSGTPSIAAHTPPRAIESLFEEIAGA